MHTYIESIQEEVEKKIVTVPEHKRTKGGRKPIPDDLPCIEVIIDIPAEEKVRVCGKSLKLNSVMLCHYTGRRKYF